MLNSTQNYEKNAEKEFSNNSDYVKKMESLWGSITDETFIRHPELVSSIG